MKAKLMSDQITTAMVKQYEANVLMLSQQEGSVLENAVMRKPLRGKTAFFEQVGKAVAQKNTTRHSDTPQMDTPHDRRAVSGNQFIYNDFIDDHDAVRTLADFTNPYAIAGGYAMGRAKDEEIIAAATGSANTGVDGGTAVPLPAASKVPVNLGGATIGLTIAKLIDAARRLGKGNVSKTEDRFIVVSQQQIDDLLATTEIRSADFNSVKALVQGEIDTFMGFKFIQTELLALSAGDIRTCFAFTRGGLGLAVSRDQITRVTERPDKNYSTQVWTSMDIGATRIEEAKVIEILCDESP